MFEVSKMKVMDKEDSNIKGKATVVVDHCFVIKDIAVMSGKNGLFVQMPSKINEKNGEYYNTMFPITKEAREELDQCVMDAYKEEYTRLQANQDKTTSMKAKVNLVNIPESNLMGFANVTIADALAIRGIRIMNGKNGMFLQMPSYKSNLQREENDVYVDQAFPITAKAREDLNQCVTDELEKELEKARHIEEGLKQAQKEPELEPEMN